MANTKMYQVRVLVSDGQPGLLPFTYHLPAPNRDQAISTVRKRIRERSNGLHVVKHIDHARQAMLPAR